MEDNLINDSAGKYAHDTELYWKDSHRKSIAFGVFIAGAKSDAAKSYWYKQFQSEQYSLEDMYENMRMAYDSGLIDGMNGKRDEEEKYLEPMRISEPTAQEQGYSLEDLRHAFDAGSDMKNYHTSWDIEWKYPTFPDYFNEYQKQLSINH